MRFYGYFKEHVVESRLENHRVRRVTIFYFLEDKSIQITEPKQTNAGIPQGAFLKRQMVLKSDGSGAPFMPMDFGIGTDIAINGRIFRLVGCDDYTRQFFQVSTRFKSTQFKFNHLIMLHALLTLHTFLSPIIV